MSLTARSIGSAGAQPGLAAWTPGAPRPAYYALKQTIEKLKDYSSAEKLSVGANVVAYRFSVRGRPIVVAWGEPGRIYFPDETEPMTKLNLPISAPRAIVTRAITEMGISTPRAENVDATGGILTLTLDSTPVFVEPEIK